MKDQNFLIQNGVDVIKSLELFGDMEMYNESLADFLSEVSDKMAKINQFKEAGDMPNYSILVHSLKSDAKYFGFTKLAELAYAHELKSKENELAYVSNNYAELTMETTRVIGLVKSYLGTNKNEGTSLDNTPTIPRVDNAISLDTQIPLSHLVGAEQSSVTYSILVVDDSDIIKNFIQKKFSNKYVVKTAADGEEAIDIIRNTFDLSAMLLDLNMPNVDGFAVLDYMREQDLFRHIPVSIITGNDAKDVDAKAFQYPIIDIIKKPFSESSIKTALEKTISSKGSKF